MSDKLIDYVKKGVKQGFNTDYIRKVLTKHGYSKAEIEFAIAKAAPHKVTYKPTKEHKMWFTTGAAVVAIILLLLLGTWMQAQTEKKTLQREVVEGQRDVQNYMDKVAELSEEIDAKERTIDQQIEDLKAKDDQNQQLLKDIDVLYKSIKEERSQVRDLLVELLKEVVERFKEQPEWVEYEPEPMLAGDLTSDRSADNVRTTT